MIEHVVQSPPEESAAPIALYELQGATFRPHRFIEFVLGQHDRLMQNIVGQKHLSLLVALLFLGSIVLTLPYGAVLSLTMLWKIAVLFTGSVLVCFPSLFVFGQYVGFRLTLSQTLAVTLIIAATAAMFSLGFFPILWFVSLTTTAVSTSAATLSGGLLGGAMFLGVAHLSRCLRSAPQLAPRSGHRLLMATWIGLLIFITWRMAFALGVVT